MSKINITTGLIGNIAKMLDSEFLESEDIDGEIIKGSKNEINDKGRTYEITMRESAGGSWHAFKELFIKVYKTYENEMDFNPPAMHEWEPNGGTSAKFFYEGNPYMLFVHMDGANHDKYSISITKSSYNEQGKEEYEEYLKGL